MYLVSFGPNEKQMWSIANRYVDWYIDLLSEYTDDEELKDFIRETSYVNGVSFDDDYPQENHLRDAYRDLLKGCLPRIVNGFDQSDPNYELKKHLAKLLGLVNESNT